ncbi:MAG: hypothetical protein NTW86_05470 [Candidatus Sumerlaeota bacterium]|nr:hypothetical protein [Candidatus Sumerlaeota bacterium]
MELPGTGQLKFHVVFDELIRDQNYMTADLKQNGQGGEILLTIQPSSRQEGLSQVCGPLPVGEWALELRSDEYNLEAIPETPTVVVEKGITKEVLVHASKRVGQPY